MAVEVATLVGTSELRATVLMLDGTLVTGLVLDCNLDYLSKVSTDEFSPLRVSQSTNHDPDIDHSSDCDRFTSKSKRWGRFTGYSMRLSGHFTDVSKYSVHFTDSSKHLGHFTDARKHFKKGYHVVVLVKLEYCLSHVIDSQ